MNNPVANAAATHSTGVRLALTRMVSPPTQYQSGMIPDLTANFTADRIDIPGRLKAGAAAPAYVTGGAATAAAAGGAGRRLNRMRWYSQPIATSTSPRHMNDRAR